LLKFLLFFPSCGSRNLRKTQVETLSQLLSQLSVATRVFRELRLPQLKKNTKIKFLTEFGLDPVARSSLAKAPSPPNA